MRVNVELVCLKSENINVVAEKATGKCQSKVVLTACDYQAWIDAFLHNPDIKGDMPSDTQSSEQRRSN